MYKALGGRIVNLGGLPNFTKLLVTELANTLTLRNGYSRRGPRLRYISKK